MVTRDDIAKGFLGLGLEPGCALLIHSSLKSFGRVDGGAEAVVAGIIDALGPEGTLLAPTLTGHEELFPDNPPHVDLRTAPCWTGAIPEAVRLHPDAVRSTHPTHSCTAIGACAEELTAGHELTPTPCGITSPYFRVAQAGGYIAMIGCTLERCTTCHTVEEIANVGFHLQKEIAYGTCIDRHGNTVETPCLLHSYKGPERDYPVLEPILLEKGLMRIGKVGESTVRLINSMGLILTALERLRHDLYYMTVLRGKGQV